MRSAQAIIGANWGDEGKGLAVDALAYSQRLKDRNVTVIRANGGAQAGHTVDCPHHGRHVFHHVGAGALVGASTHLSQFFVAHPMMLSEELNRLAQMGAQPQRITIDPRSAVTTPWDMAINQALEMARGGSRHGSTGLGFGETIERTQRGPQLFAADLWSADLVSRLDQIKKQWLAHRLNELGLVADDTPLGAVLSGIQAVSDAFLRDCQAFVASVSLLDDRALPVDNALLFEGAQGLQLDMNFGTMPYVTRSRTGLANIIHVAREAGIEHIQPIYMTRAYATRHGAGPLPHEAPVLADLPWLNLQDSTNAPNPWQGRLRTAPLDLDVLKQTIMQDLNEQRGCGIVIEAGLGVTCLDQIKEAAQIVVEEKTADILPDNLPSSLGHVVGLPTLLQSWGARRNDTQLSVPLG